MKNVSLESQYLQLLGPEYEAEVFFFSDLGGTASKLEVYDKKNCTMVFMININSNMYGEMILNVFEIFRRGISKKFNIKVHKLQDTFLGTWTRATCVLKMSRESP